MNLLNCISVAVFGLLVCLTPSSAAPGRSPLLRAFNSENALPGKYLVKVDLSTDPAKTRAALNKLRMKYTSFSPTAEGGPSAVRLLESGLVELDLDPSQLLALRDDNLVSAVEEVQIFYPTARSALSWGLDRINQVQMPLDGDASYWGPGGEGVDVYVVDTGIDLENNAAQFEGRARRFWTGYGDGLDRQGHGTHTAGTVGSRDYGVAPRASIFSVKVFDGSGGTTTTILRGLEAVRQGRAVGRPAVVSMSLGGGYSGELNSAVARLVAEGVTVVVAAGNDNKDACAYSPASESSVITVGATSKYGSTDTKASFSNWGRCVDISAPGQDIQSTYMGRTGPRSLSGTSMACPHVSGAAALYLSQNPTAKPAQVASALLGVAGSNQISGLSNGTPNKMLYTAFAQTQAASVAGKVVEKPTPKAAKPKAKSSKVKSQKSKSLQLRRKNRQVIAEIDEINGSHPN